jgi:hypothetical protein
MPSLNTVYRAVVMIATGLIVVKGWQLYGPSTEQVKTFALTALEKAQAALGETGHGGANPAPTTKDPRLLLPQTAGTNPTDAEPNDGADAIAPPLAVAPPALADFSTAPVRPVETETDGDDLTPLLARLQELGGSDAKIAPWGTSGELYRCCCQAKVAESSPIARHFEAVASEPAAAVEQVVAKVEAWRTERQSLLR